MLAPVRLIPFMVIATTFGFVTVTLTGLEDVFTNVSTKFTVAGESVSPAGVTPVPVSDEVLGLLEAFDVTVRSPVCTPLAEG